MSLTDVMNNIGFIRNLKKEMTCSGSGCDVEISDGKVIGNPYTAFANQKDLLNTASLNAAYKKVSCVGTSIDLVCNNIQMIEPVFWNDEKREAMEYPSDKRLKSLRRLFEKPNAIENRKQFLAKCAKNYSLHGIIYFAFVMDDDDIVSIKVIDNNSVSTFSDVKNAKVDYYTLTNAGAYNGTYTFNGSHYVNQDKPSYILAPYFNADVEYQYLPASPLAGTGVEALMYWYGCFHNKSLLENGARPSMIVLIKSLLNPNHREELKNEIRIKHSGASNAGNAIILDGAADKDIKQLSQNNKDMEFSTILSAAEEAIYRRFGVNWILGKGVSSKDYKEGMEMFYDMTICPLFQGLYNHLFDVYKYYNPKYSNFRISYLEQDIPALKQRFIERMSKIPQLAIFTIGERRKMFNFAPLGDERDDELVAQTVSVIQSGKNGTNTTQFTGGENQEEQN